LEHSLSKQVTTILLSKKKIEQGSSSILQFEKSMPGCGEEIGSIPKL